MSPDSCPSPKVRLVTHHLCFHTLGPVPYHSIYPPTFTPKTEFLVCVIQYTVSAWILINKSRYLLCKTTTKTLTSWLSSTIRQHRETSESPGLSGQVGEVCQGFFFRAKASRIDSVCSCYYFDSVWFGLVDLFCWFWSFVCYYSVFVVLVSSKILEWIEWWLQNPET